MTSTNYAMKKVLFVLLVLSVSICSAQEYDPVLKDGAYWDRKYTEFSVTGSCSSYDRTQIAGDTLINNISYKKLVRTSLYDENGKRTCIEGPLYLDDRDLIPVTNYFLREDINSKKLFIFDNNDPDNGQEFLLCDFNLEVGDELVNFYGQTSSDALTITSITTNTDNKKEYTVSDGSVYREGLGKVSGNDIPYNLTIDYVEHEVSCFGSNDNPTNCVNSYNMAIKESSFWDVSTTGPGVCTYMNKYRIGENFIHNGTTYKKIEFAPIRDVTFPNDLCLTGGDLFVNENEFQESPNVFIRENLAEKRVYILVKDDQNNFQEYTAADFSLNLGDEMTNAFTYLDGSGAVPGMDLTVTHIDTQSDGRKRFTVADGESYEEGVGSNQGPIQIYRPYELYEDVNSVSCYGNDNFLSGTCVEVLSTNTYKVINVNVYPNPTSGFIHIANNNNYNFKLYSILGKQMEFQFSDVDQEMDISHLKSGIYFLQIRGKNNTRRTLKIFKN